MCKLHISICGGSSVFNNSATNIYCSLVQSEMKFNQNSLTESAPHIGLLTPCKTLLRFMLLPFKALEALGSDVLQSELSE
jgi:hypothetical protein